LALEDLPNRAVERIAQYASTPTTPAACLLPLVCRGWRAEVSRAQLLVDICLDLAPVKQAIRSINFQEQYSRAATADAAALLHSRQLATWLAKHSGSVRTLRIVMPSSTLRLTIESEQEMTAIRDALPAPQQGPAGGMVLPHLVQLELPVMGLPGSSTWLQALAGCPSLQQLTLKQARGLDFFNTEAVDIHLLASAVAPLTQLQVLHVDLPRPAGWSCRDSLDKLLAALSPSLQELFLRGQLQQFDHLCITSITHLVNLQALLEVPVVLATDPAYDLGDDYSSSSGSDNTSGSSSSRSSSSGDITSTSSSAALTALTRLHVDGLFFSDDARLGLPNLRGIKLRDAEPGTWKQLQGMQHLRQLTALRELRKESYDRLYRRGLQGVTQLEQLVLHLGIPGEFASPRGMAPWAAAIACLTGLTTLTVPAAVVVFGAPGRPSPLTQLRQLTVGCDAAGRGIRWHLLASGAEGWDATTAGGVVNVVAAAVGAGWRPLQRLVLVIRGDPSNWELPAEEVATAASAALPGLEVEVQQLVTQHA
jgi:hypothetical protein